MQQLKISQENFLHPLHPTQKFSRFTAIRGMAIRVLKKMAKKILLADYGLPMRNFICDQNNNLVKQQHFGFKIYGYQNYKMFVCQTRRF